MLTLVSPPGPVVSTAEAKRHLRVEHADDDGYIEALVAAATAHVDGADGWLGRALGLQAYDLKLDGLWWSHPCGSIRSPWWVWHGHGLGWRLKLPLPPLVSVDAVAYRDGEGVERVYPPSSYVVAGVGRSEGGHIELASGAVLPSLHPGPEALRVHFTAGYEAVPAPIRHAILLMVGDLYANRESGGVGSVSFHIKMPTTVDALLAPFRVWG